MSDTQYTYAVARIRALEGSLFTQALIDQLLAVKSYEGCLQFLTEQGWGEADTPMTADAILAKEREKTWKVARELIKDMSVFDVLSYPDEFHNLKAAVKQACHAVEIPQIFYGDTSIKAEDMLRMIKEKEFHALPAFMAAAAKEAYEVLLHTRDGQLCDIIIDKAALDAIYQAGKASDVSIIKEYAESTVAVANIKIAVRCQKTGKRLDFMKRALAECDSLSISALAQAAVNGMDAVQEYLSGTNYSKAAEALAESPSAFERWCDNRIIETIRPQKYQAFSVGPVVAYVLARENEIKTVRIILSGKQNGLPEQSIRERVREMYV